MRKQEGGITLIALVVTIVVLLILAAVSISMLGGENGIITQAIEAREENKKEEAKEEVYLYWNEAQINYEDTIEQKVDLLKKRMQEKDANATANIEDGEIIVNYKGYDVTISYINKKLEGEIAYFTAFHGHGINEQDKTIYLYITKDSKIYITNNDRKICLNDKFDELNDEKNLRFIESGTSNNSVFFEYMSNQKLLKLTLNNIDIENIFNLDNYSLEVVFDIKTIESGKYYDRNIKYIELNFYKIAILDDGFLYRVNEENKLQKIELQDIENNAKIENFCMIVNNRELLLVLLDQNGKMYNIETQENLSNIYANGFFKDKNISLATAIRKEGEIFNTFITKDGKAYIHNSSTNEIECLNDMETNLNNKKITNIYNLSNDFEEDYIIIVTDEGKIYYTDDLSNFYSLDIDGFPKLTIKYS